MSQRLKFNLFQLVILGIVFTSSIFIVSAQSKIKSRCKEDKESVRKEFVRGSALDIASDDGPAVSGDYGSDKNLINSNKTDTVEKIKVYPEGFKPLQILSKPRAIHTEASRKNCIEGKVILKATFFSDRTVGNIKIIKGLPFGLSKQAIEAAKKIKFEPQLKDNKPVSVTKKIEYGFWLY